MVDASELCKFCNKNIDLEEHDKQIKEKVINEITEAFNERMFYSQLIQPIMTRNEILLFLQQLKEKANE